MKFLDSMLLDPDDQWLTMALASEKANIAELTPLADTLRVSYKSYTTSITNPNVELAATTYAGHKMVLIDYYMAPPTSIAKIMRHRRNENNLEECPYCGYPFTPDTLDHFIPKDEWPEYAFYPNNLVPQCRGCMPTKGANYFCNTEGTAKYLHPFYSDLISKIGFTVTVNFEGGEPNFSVNFVAFGPVTDDSRARIAMHVKHLKLRSRILLYCRRTYNFWLKKARHEKFNIVELFEVRLGQAQAEERASRNWGNAFFKCMLANKDVIDFLYSQMPETRPAEVDIVLLDI
ncbi:hypothetical protein BCF11_2126 [Collimonas sp. PA-H2]|uniref:HNH endonuclease n=1 Tax=Collimonas sp. PA-H2 TaxID=1881062 RepID=UPI000C01AE4B|nr:HNH endonuclease [Collimonas sp. PA-H2]PFH09725.1 hypothetical protein BCF11_2126 [Collimonas sp. PA-H2]